MRQLVKDVAEAGDGRVSLVRHFLDPCDYWAFLGCVDVTFSCAREESFGVAMLEHAAAGVACVCPRTLAYPEVHQGALLVPPDADSIVDGVCSLVRDAGTRSRVARRGAEVARRYAVEAGVRRLCDQLQRVDRDGGRPGERG